MSLPLSVLDLVPITSGSTSAQALRNSIELAKVVDRLGYTRYWFAEHHNMSSIASSVPEVMIGQVARETEHLRVGSGGVMLPNHPPLKIAETFRMLEALYPGRIDLGIGRAPGTDPLTAFALRRNKDALNSRDFPDHLLELMAFARDEFPEDHPFKDVRAMPADVGFPDIWLLGSSANGSEMAASLGVAYAFAHHINPQNAIPALRTYRANFKPSKYLEQPYAVIACAVICADTDEEAEWLASSVALSIVRLRNGQPIQFPSPEEAMAYPYTPEERAQAKAYRESTQIVGSPATVRRQIDRLVEDTGADEVMVVTLIHSHEARVHSYELLAKEYGLTPRQ
jgi:luciferase family oxidoreductase group 1